MMPFSWKGNETEIRPFWSVVAVLSCAHVQMGVPCGAKRQTSTFTPTMGRIVNPGATGSLSR